METIFSYSPGQDVPTSRRASDTPRALRQVVKMKRREVKQLKKLLDDEEQKTAELGSEKQHLEEMNKSQERKIKDMQTIIIELRAALEATAHIPQLESQLADLRNENESLKQASRMKDELTCENEQFAAELEEAKFEIQTLLEKVSVMRENEKQFVAFQESEGKDSENRMKLLELQREKLTKELTEDLRVLNIENDFLSKQKTELQEELMATKKEKEELMLELSEKNLLEVKLESAGKQICDLIKNHRVEKENIEANFEAMKQMLKEEQAKIERELIEQFEKEKEVIASERTQEIWMLNDSHKAAIQELRDVHSEQMRNQQEKFQALQSDLNAQLQLLTEMLEKLTDENEKGGEEIRNLKTELTATEKKFEVTEKHLKEEILVLGEQLKNETTAKSNLEKDYEDIKTKSELLMKEFSQLAAEKTQNEDEFLQELTLLKKDFQNQTVIQLQEREHFLKDKEEMTDMVGLLQKENEQLRQEVQNGCDELLNVRKDYEEKEKAVIGLKEQLEKTQIELTLQETNFRRTTEEKSLLEGKLESAEKQICDLTETHRIQKEEMEAHFEQIKKLLLEEQTKMERALDQFKKEKEIITSERIQEIEILNDSREAAIQELKNMHLEQLRSQEENSRTVQSNLNVQLQFTTEVLQRLQNESEQQIMTLKSTLAATENDLEVTKKNLKDDIAMLNVHLVMETSAKEELLKGYDKCRLESEALKKELNEIAEEKKQHEDARLQEITLLKETFENETVIQLEERDRLVKEKEQLSNMVDRLQKDSEQLKQEQQINQCFINEQAKKVKDILEQFEKEKTFLASERAQEIKTLNDYHEMAMQKLTHEHLEQLKSQEEKAQSVESDLSTQLQMMTGMQETMKNENEKCVKEIQDLRSVLSEKALLEVKVESAEKQICDLIEIHRVAKEDMEAHFEQIKNILMEERMNVERDLLDQFKKEKEIIASERAQEITVLNDSREAAMQELKNLNLEQFRNQEEKFHLIQSDLKTQLQVLTVMQEKLKNENGEEIQLLKSKLTSTEGELEVIKQDLKNEITGKSELLKDYEEVKMVSELLKKDFNHLAAEKKQYEAQCAREITILKENFENQVAIQLQERDQLVKDKKEMANKIDQLQKENESLKQEVQKGCDELFSKAKHLEELNPP